MKDLKKIIYLTTSLLLTALFSVPLSTVSAMTKDDQESFIAKTPWYDKNDLGCGDTSGGQGDGNLTVGKDFSLGPLTDAKTRHINLIKALMSDLGLTAAQASGIVGNFMVESGGLELPPDANFGGHRGPPNFNGPYGWAQWLGGRLDAFISMAVDKGYMASKNVSATDAADYAYLLSELTGSQKITIDELKKQSTPEDAGRSFEATFERSGGAALDLRMQHSREAFDEYNGGGSSSGDSSSATDTGNCGNTTTGAAIVGKYAFPLLTTKKGILNPGMFHDGTADRGGHPYIAFDILANPGTPEVAFLSGTVTTITEDKCPGRMISIYNKESDLTISYLHMDFALDPAVKLNAQINVAQLIGKVGPPPNGCGIPHLHIDAAAGTVRPGCKRESCPPANAAKFRDIGPQLFETYQKLKDN